MPRATQLIGKRRSQIDVVGPDVRGVRAHQFRLMSSSAEFLNFNYVASDSSANVTPQIDVVGPDVRAKVQQLKECAELAKKFQAREVLFGLEQVGGGRRRADSAHTL